MELSRYRKLVAAMVTAGGIKLLEKFGLDLSVIGVSMGEIAGEAADFILSVGIPGFALWLFPQEPEDGSEGPTRRKLNNRRLLIFVAGVAGAVAAGIGVSYL
jgi:hypothetical protein